MRTRRVRISEHPNTRAAMDVGRETCCKFVTNRADASRPLHMANPRPDCFIPSMSSIGFPCSWPHNGHGGASSKPPTCATTCARIVVLTPNGTLVNSNTRSYPSCLTCTSQRRSQAKPARSLPSMEGTALKTAKPRALASEASNDEDMVGNTCFAPEGDTLPRGEPES